MKSTARRNHRTCSCGLAKSPLRVGLHTRLTRTTTGRTQEPKNFNKVDGRSRAKQRRIHEGIIDTFRIALSTGCGKMPFPNAHEIGTKRPIEIVIAVDSFLEVLVSLDPFRDLQNTRGASLRTILPIHHCVMYWISSSPHSPELPLSPRLPEIRYFDRALFPTLRYCLLHGDLGPRRAHVHQSQVFKHLYDCRPSHSGGVSVFIRTSIHAVPYKLPLSP